MSSFDPNNLYFNDSGISPATGAFVMDNREMISASSNLFSPFFVLSYTSFKVCKCGLKNFKGFGTEVIELFASP
jgi:hypothetical protein